MTDELDYKKDIEKIIMHVFPGYGKTYTVENKLFEHSGLKIVDLDSGNYKWPVDEKGNRSYDKPVDNWVEKYYLDINKHLFEFNCDIVMISTHKEVIQMTYEKFSNRYNKIERIIVVPSSKHYKDFFLERYRKRGSSPEFIKLVEENWDNWIDEYYELYKDIKYKIFRVLFCTEEDTVENIIKDIIKNYPKFQKF